MSNLRCYDFVKLSLGLVRISHIRSLSSNPFAILMWIGIGFGPVIRKVKLQRPFWQSGELARSRLALSGRSFVGNESLAMDAQGQKLRALFGSDLKLSGLLWTYHQSWNSRLFCHLNLAKSPLSKLGKLCLSCLSKASLIIWCLCLDSSAMGLHSYPAVSGGKWYQPVGWSQCS
jgi:hypothetical protein